MPGDCKARTLFTGPDSHPTKVKLRRGNGFREVRTSTEVILPTGSRYKVLENGFLEIRGVVWVIPTYRTPSAPGSLALETVRD